MNHSPAFLCDIFSANSNSNKNVPGLYRLTGSLLVPEPAWTSIKNRPPLKTGHFEPQRSQPGIFGRKSSHPGNSASLCTFWDGEFTLPFFSRFFSRWPSRIGDQVGSRIEGNLDDHLWGINIQVTIPQPTKSMAQNSATRETCFWTHEIRVFRLGPAPGASNGALHTCTWKAKKVPKNANDEVLPTFYPKKEAFNESLSNSQMMLF